MKKHLHFDEKMICRKIIRYNDMPGQALSYKIGKRNIIFKRKLIQEI